MVGRRARSHCRFRHLCVRSGLRNRGQRVLAAAPRSPRRRPHRDYRRALFCGSRYETGRQLFSRVPRVVECGCLLSVPAQARGVACRRGYNRSRSANVRTIQVPTSRPRNAPAPAESDGIDPMVHAGAHRACASARAGAVGDGRLARHRRVFLGSRLYRSPTRRSLARYDLIHRLRWGTLPLPGGPVRTGVTAMVAAVRVHKVGGPDVLTYEDISVPAPGPGQIKIKNHACGVNFIDTYFRMGMYPSPAGLPFVSGNEGAGEVLAVGPDVTDIKIGDRVGYVSALGAYAAERVLPADRAVKLPAGISYEQAAAMMLKGLTAQYLLRRTYRVQKGDNVLIHAAAGGVGLIACQWANHLGANVIGTVGSNEKAELAKRNGAHHVILYRDEDFVAKVKEITGGALCAAVFDGVGKTTLPASLD